MRRITHPLFSWPGSLFWLLPFSLAVILFLQFGLSGSLLWYLCLPALISLSFFNLFSKVWLGISILTTLFFYCSIGSSGVPISLAIWEPTSWVSLRELRWFEMTEFEWFHWWPFKWLVALLCLNMGIVTVRKIPLNVLNIGVWTIHTGVIVLVLGCVYYFTQKIEGDVLLSRNRVAIQLPSGLETSMLVAPGNSVQLGEYRFSIADINPNWELMSGDDKGVAAYSVSVSIEGPETSFIRQLLSGYPEYTEDVIQTGNPNQPMSRAKNVLGKPLVDETISLSLVRDPKSEFFITQTAAIYVRTLNPDGTPQTGWLERPLYDAPRFNDYVSFDSEVWDVNRYQLSPPLNLPAASYEPGDDLPAIEVTDYLRYAFMDSRVVPGGGLNPVVWGTLQQGSINQPIKLFALDPSSNTTDSSLMLFKWIEDEKQLRQLEESLSPTLQATVNGDTVDLPITTDNTFSPIGESDYLYKIQSIQNNLKIDEAYVSLIILELQQGDKTWVRWVFEDESLSRDVNSSADHLASQAKDENVLFNYSPGAAPITLIAGKGVNNIELLTQMSSEKPTRRQLEINEPINLLEGVAFTVSRVEPLTRIETRPTIVPKNQRDPSVSNTMSMVRVQVQDENNFVAAWLPYHHYPFQSIQEAVHRFRYQPTTVTLSDGRQLELLFSRQKTLLPSEIALVDFEIDTHIGGFTGRTSSILNWRSIVEFPKLNAAKLLISVNDPKPQQGYWFFQSQWDPPDSTSLGLNYTVLGVGNRKGVFVMLLGTCIAVSGMLWAFCVKPAIKRKRQQAVYEELR